MRKIVLVVFVVLAFFTKGNAQVHLKDSLALVDLYDSCDGINWKDKWNLHSPVSTWHGIKLTNQNYVQWITLSKRGLKGVLPSSLGNLKHLHDFDLSSNQLTGSIPPSIGNCSNLKYVWLFNNNLTGSIPASIGNLTHLRYLYLSNNQLTGTIPSSFSNLQNLYGMELMNNKLSGNLPSFLSKLQSLSVIFIANNQFTGTIPDSLTYLHSIRLSLSHNQFTGSIPVSLGNFNSYEYLDLSDNNLTDTIPASLSNMHADLSGTLNLSNNHLTGSIPSSFSKLQTNRYDLVLNFDSNQLSGTIPIIPDSSGSMLLSIRNNKYRFNPLEAAIPLLDTNISFHYSPQANMPLHYDGTNKLSVTAGGTLSNNTYRLSKDGTLYSTQAGDSVFTINANGHYWITVKNTIAKQLMLFSDTVIVTNFGKPTNGNFDVTGTEIKIFPNPATDKLNILFSASQNETAQIEIADMQGRIIAIQNKNIAAGTSTQTINVASLAKGNYLLRIKTAEGEKSAGFVKE